MSNGFLLTEVGHGYIIRRGVDRHLKGLGGARCAWMVVGNGLYAVRKERPSIEGGMNYAKKDYLRYSFGGGFGAFSGGKPG